MTAAHRAACSKMRRGAARIRTAKVLRALPGSVRVPARTADEELTQPIPYESIAEVARAWREQMAKERAS